MLRVPNGQNAHLFWYAKKTQVSFMGKQRQESYLKTFQALGPEARKALMDIYDQAHKGEKEMGRHVPMAMVASVRYPELFRFTLSNIVLRLLVKRFQLEGDWRKMLQMQEVLDDFHVALDQFAEICRKESLPQLALLNGGRADVGELRQFKGRAGGPIARVKQSWRR
jgi:hypothetical protein